LIKFWRSGIAFADKTGNLYVIVAYTRQLLPWRAQDRSLLLHVVHRVCTPIYLQKSPRYLQKRPTFPHDPCKWCNINTLTHKHMSKIWYTSIYLQIFVCVPPEILTDIFLFLYDVCCVAKMEGKWRYKVTSSRVHQKCAYSSILRHIYVQE